MGENRQITFRLSNLSSSHVMKFQWPSSPSLVFLPCVGHIRPKTNKTITVTFKANKPQVYKAQKVLGKMWKISFSKSLSKIPDWDDRMKSVQWVAVAQSAPPMPATGLENTSMNSIAATNSTASKPPHNAPLKKKVVETEKEPPHRVLEDSYRDLELSVTGVADFCKYECGVRDIRFKETLIYQSRVYTFPIKNTGRIELSYQWSIHIQESRPSTARSGIDEKESVYSVETTLPFSVTPMSGTIQPDKEVSITVRYSPLRVMEIHCLLHCQ